MIYGINHFCKFRDSQNNERRVCTVIITLNWRPIMNGT